jgi:hypothetical protein
MAAQRKFGLDLVFQGTNAELIEAGRLRLGESLIGKVHQRRTPPQPERFIEAPRGAGWIAVA